MLTIKLEHNWIALYVFVWLVVVSSPAMGLDGTKALHQYVHRKWGIDDGLSQLSVTAVLQTDDGYIWIGTQEGLARFDGQRFTNYHAGDPEVMKTDEVTALAETSDRSLWIGTNGSGVLRYRNGRFEAFGPSYSCARDTGLTWNYNYVLTNTGHTIVLHMLSSVFL